MEPRLNATLTPVTPTRGGAAPADGASEARQVAFQRTLAPLVGKSMAGEVLAHLTDGNYLVKVAGSSVRMMLPPGTPVGGQIPLTLVAAEPRPTFQVANQQRGQPGALLVANLDAEFATDEPDLATRDSVSLGQGNRPQADTGKAASQGTAAQSASQAASARPLSLAATLLGKAPLTPTNELPGFDPSAPAPTLSSAARTIASVLSQAQTSPNAPVAVSGKTPLADAGPPDTAKLAARLHQEVGQSGLFYESHVAEWAEGKRGLPDLSREPQMQPAPGQTSAQHLASAAGGPDLAAAQMINLQLNTHEQARLQWQGEAWPGQAMQWDVSKDQQGRQPDGGEAAPGWRSAVRFRFPLLGDVAASVLLVNGQLHIQVQAGSEQAAGALRQQTAALHGALDAVGAPLASLSIVHAPVAGAAQPDARSAAGADHDAGAAEDGAVLAQGGGNGG